MCKQRLKGHLRTVTWKMEHQFRILISKTLEWPSPPPIVFINFVL